MIIKKINLLKGTAEISINKYNICEIQYNLHKKMNGYLLELDYENLEKIEHIINTFCSTKLNKIFNKNKKRFRKFKWKYDKKNLSLNLYGYKGIDSLYDGLKDFLTYLDKYIYYIMLNEEEITTTLSVLNEIKKTKEINKSMNKIS